jgi:hypothetical protein
LELAARISNRYRHNVFFYSAHKPSVYIAKKAQLRGDARIIFAGDRAAAFRVDLRRDQAAIHLLDTNSADVGQACKIAGRFQHEHPAGCAVLILDGYCSLPERLERFDLVDAIPQYRAERWPHTLMSREVLADARRLNLSSGIPIVFGITTASLMDDDAIMYSFPLESEVRRIADHWVVLHRQEIYRETRERQDSERNLVRLTGTSPSWWDTRCSGLRFDPKRVGFSTVA